MTTRTLTPLLNAALAEGRALGLDLEAVPRPPTPCLPEPDAWVRMKHGKQARTYPVMLRRGLAPGTLGAVLHQLATWGPEALLVVDYVTPPLAEALRAEGVAFLDAAGNAYLDHPPLLIWVKGQRRKAEPMTEEPLGRAFQPRGLQVLFALLCRPELADLPYREIAAQAGVAHGTVGGVMAELPKLGFVAELKGRRRLIQGERLLAQWVEAYARTLRPKLLLGRFHTNDLAWVEDLDLRGTGLLLGGEPAADRVTHYLKPGTATFFGEQVDPRLVVTHRMRKNPAGNIEFRRRFWTFEGEEEGLVPLVLIYADLLAIGDGRCLETAKLLTDQIHARLV